MGDTVFLPLNSSFGKIVNHAKEENPPWKKFDGVYPAHWPTAITLPSDSFLIQSGKINQREPTAPYNMFPNHNTLQVRGIVRGEPKAIYDYFRREISNLGIDITKEQHTPKTQIVPQLPPTPASYDLYIEGSPTGNVANLLLSVYEDEGLDGWVRYELSMLAGP